MPCPDCGRAFGTRQGLQAHRARVHGHRSEARLYVDGPACGACLTFFGARPRVLVHVRDSPRCLGALRANRRPLDPAEVDRLDAEDREYGAMMRRRGRRLLWASMVACRMPGPLPWHPGGEDGPPPPESAGRPSSVQGAGHGAPAAAGQGEVRRGAPPPSADGEAARRAPAAPAHGPDAMGGDHEAPSQGPRVEGDLDAGAIGDGPADREVCGDHLGPEEPDWRRGAGSLRLGRAPPLRQLIIAHLYCGPRRPGDFQEAAEAFAGAHGVPVTVLSVDILHGTAADLTCKDHLARWRHWCRTGVVAAILGGPPCNTWSRARAAPGGPAMVRSVSALWGLPDLPRQAAAQVEAANCLLLVALLLVADLAVSGGSALIEHPATIWRERLPSIWRLAATRRLASLGCVDVVRIDQCQVGSLAKAPTTLLALRCAPLRALLAELPGQGLCTHRAHQLTLVGRAADGSWKTAQKREYPPAFCSSLARALLPGPLQRHAADAAGPELPEECVPFCVPLAAGVGRGGWRDLDAPALCRGGGQRAGAREKRRADRIAELATDDCLLSGLLDEGRAAAHRRPDGLEDGQPTGSPGSASARGPPEWSRRATSPPAPPGVSCTQGEGPQNPDTGVGGGDGPGHRSSSTPAPPRTCSRGAASSEPASGAPQARSRSPATLPPPAGPGSSGTPAAGPQKPWAGAGGSRGTGGGAGSCPRVGGHTREEVRRPRTAAARGRSPGR